MKRTLVYLVGGLICALCGCSEVSLVDVSLDPDHQPLVGRRYEVVGRLDAYGIRPHSKAEVEYITLMPPPGVGGSEVGFRVRVEPGSSVTIMKVMRTSRWFDCGIALIVAVEGPSMPAAATTRVEMNRGNEGHDCLSLNPGVYRNLQ